LPLGYRSTGRSHGRLPPVAETPRHNGAVTDPYYRPALARVHHEGFGLHGDAVAPGILALLAPVLAAGGLVVELGCGSGLLTRHLVAAGHRLIATDASPAMLDIARDTVPDVLVDAATVPGLLAMHGVRAEVQPAFGTETLPEGLVAIVGTKG
jgi:SAM-dependent methyltransferase